MIDQPAADPIGFRAAAGLAALVTWAGLGIQLVASIELEGSVGAALSEMLRFFTVLANLGLAVTTTAIALGAGPRVSGAPFAIVVLAMMLVGIVYSLLLRGLVPLAGLGLLADHILHDVTTVLAPLLWLFLAPKGRLDARLPWRALAVPVGYFAYALARAGVDERYPYPFMDVSARGWGGVLSSCAVMAALFIAGGYAMRAIDRWLGPRSAG